MLGRSVRTVLLMGLACFTIAATYDASTYGDDCAAIQRAIDDAVIYMAEGGTRGATIYAPRIPGKQAWVCDEPIRLGDPVGQIRLVGDGGPGAESLWGGTLIDGSNIEAGRGVIEILGGRGHSLEGLSVRASAAHGIWVRPGPASHRSVSRLRVRDVSVATGSDATAFLVEGETDNDQADTILLEELQLSGGIGLRIASRQAVGINVVGGAIRGEEYGVLHELGFVHMRGVQLGTTPTSKALIRQIGGQSHLTLADGYAEVSAGDFLRIEGEHWRPTTVSRTRVYMQNGNPGRFVVAPGAQNLQIPASTTFEQGPGQQRADGSWLDNEPILHPAVLDRAIRLGPGSRPAE